MKKGKSEKPRAKKHSVEEIEDGVRRAHEVVSSPAPAVTRILCWESFFACQHSPIIRSTLLTCLMAGTVLQVERIPASALLDAVLLATAARKMEAEIVDDYDALLSRAEEVWSKPDFTHKVMDNTHGRWANCIIKGQRDFFDEEQYIPRMVEWYCGQEVPKYMAQDMSDADLAKYRKTHKKAA